MKFNVTRFVTAKVYRATGSEDRKLRGFFWVNRPNYRYDEYWNTWTYTPYYKPYDGPSASLKYQGPYPFREIPGTIVTHDIGNGESDFQLDKVVLDAQYDTKHYRAYKYNAVKPDPILSLELRNTSYAGETPTLTIDVIAQNHAAIPGINPWKSRMDTPGGTTISSNDVNATREALVLVVPFAKYRRSRAYISTAQKMTTIRGMQVLATEFPRRTYG